MLEYLYCHQADTQCHCLAHRRALEKVKASKIFKRHRTAVRKIFSWKKKIVRKKKCFNKNFIEKFFCWNKVFVGKIFFAGKKKVDGKFLGGLSADAVFRLFSGTFSNFRIFSKI